MYYYLKNSRLQSPDPVGIYSKHTKNWLYLFVPLYFSLKNVIKYAKLYISGLIYLIPWLMVYCCWHDHIKVFSQDKSPAFEKFCIYFEIFSLFLENMELYLNTHIYVSHSIFFISPPIIERLRFTCDFFIILFRKILDTLFYDIDSDFS